MATERLIGIGVSAEHEQFWAALPPKVGGHPLRELVVEALWWTGEALTARTAVDVLDGHVTMWEADHHLRALEQLGVAEAGSPEELPQVDLFDVPYRLVGEEGNNG
jgi:hypothetical protein